MQHFGVSVGPSLQSSGGSPFSEPEGHRMLGGEHGGQCNAKLRAVT
jgi:hypothetical protein